MSGHQYNGQVAGLLLAARRGRRFDPSGVRSKLLKALPTARGQTVLAQLGNGDPVYCVNPDDGMAASLVCGLQHSADAAGWVIALCDIPYVQSATVAALVSALQRGADIAVSVHQGRRAAIRSDSAGCTCSACWRCAAIRVRVAWCRHFP